MSAAVSWVQHRLGVDVTGEWARHVHLNVGGVLYTTRRHTLRRLDDHPIFGPILSGHAHRCEDGSYLLDGDGALFRYVLGFLRNGTLTVPDDFREWELLLQEVRRYHLADLEHLLVNRFEYQRSVFRRQLPHGVYVWWPTTRSGATRCNTSNSAVDAPASHLPSHGVSPSQAPTAHASSATRQGDTDAAGGPSPHAATTPLATCSTSASPNLLGCSQSIRIVPPLPGLEVEAAAAGPTVVFRRAQVLHDLDQLVTVLLTAYGYSIQHWDETRGRVLLTLPGGL